MTRRFLHNTPWSSLLDAWSEVHPRLRYTIHVRDDRPPFKQAARSAPLNSAVASAACLEGRPGPVTPSTLAVAMRRASSPHERSDMRVRYVRKPVPDIASLIRATLACPRTSRVALQERIDSFEPRHGIEGREQFLLFVDWQCQVGGDHVGGPSGIAGLPERRPSLPHLDLVGCRVSFEQCNRS